MIRCIAGLLALYSTVHTTLSAAPTWRDSLQHTIPGAIAVGLDGMVGDSAGNARISHWIRLRLESEKSNTDGQRPQRVQSTWVVTSVGNAGAGSLRAAIDSANFHPGSDVISFSISPPGPKTIAITSPLPNIVEPVTIDGTTQPGYAGTPMIELNCAAQTTSNTLNLFGGNSTVRGLIFNRLNAGSAIVLWDNGANTIEGNYFGTDITGTVRLGNSGNGVVSLSPNNVIGGVTASRRNIYAGMVFPAIGLITGSSGTLVVGNFTGTDVTGSVALGTGSGGIVINGSYNDVIGTTQPGARNIFSASGNGAPGIGIIGSGPTGSIGGTRIVGNYVGTDASGLVAFGNAGAGILVRGSPNTVIGGTTPAERNVLAASRTTSGVHIDQGSTHTVVQGNYIGLKANGTDTLGNLSGITIDGAPANLVGGPASSSANVIGGNYGTGISIANAGATMNVVRSNFIGTDPTGELNLGNGSVGVYILNASVDSILSNIITNNRSPFGGVYVSGGNRNTVRGNLIRSNHGLGIDLAPPGLNRNDSLDLDTGSNNQTNFPLIDSVRITGTGDTFIHGHLSARALKPYTIDLFTNTLPDSSHFGEAERPMTSVNVTTDLAGYARFDIQVLPLSGDDFITAIATDDSGNTSEFSQAFGVRDTDGDGIPDFWETAGWGIDVNSDSLIDLDLAAMGARPDDKDIFVEVDAMAGRAPQDTTLQRVEDAFAVSPNGGMHLHTLLSDTALPLVSWTSDPWVPFRAIKGSYFGDQSDRQSPNARNILEAKKLVFRYCVFADVRPDSISGEAEANFPSGANDFMVTLGNWPVPGGDPNQKAGTFMHELGHTLGLRHGGGDDINYKPNYISIMSYTWQMPLKWANTWRLDYSVEALPTLNESSLDESAGLDPGPSTLYGIISVPYSDSSGTLNFARLQPHTAADWDGDGAIDGAPVAVDLNVFRNSLSPSPGELLISQEDWSHLILNFRDSPAFNDSPLPRVTLAEPDEMTPSIFEFLDNLPPPKPAGQFVMDGELDSSARLVASNSGINLYVRYKSGQLYVATNTAQSQGADMFIFASDARNPLRNAPAGKSGQVATWSAYLRNESLDNSSAWSGAGDSPLTNITVDTAGTILEGVIDMELLLGHSPSELYLAVGKYGTNAGDALLAQVPSGNGDGNIDPPELVLLEITPPMTGNPEYTQQGDKLVGSGGIGAPQRGFSVAISGDGNTAIMGGHSDNSFTGGAWIFTRANGVWSQQGSKLVGAGAQGPAQQGYSVAISADGSTAIVGGWADNNTGAGSIGAAWVFVRSGDTLVQQGNKLVGGGYFGNSQQGYAVALSGDGNTAVVGGIGDSLSRGATWVFTRNGGNWSQQGEKLVGSGFVGRPFQGQAVAISGDGNTIAIGGPRDNGNLGAVWIFTRTGGTWTQQGPKFRANDAMTSSHGASVALSTDGNTLIIGGPTVAGGAWIFTRQGGMWTQQSGRLLGDDAVGAANQGNDVSLSGDGQTAFVGGPGDSLFFGAAWVYARTNGAWNQVGNKLRGLGNVGAARQGASLSVSRDGSTVIVGGYPDNASQGAAWIFVRDTPLPVQLASFSAHILGQHTVGLEWTTLSEVNNYGFEVQRSAGAMTEFSTLPNSFVSGHGTTTESHTYTYSDTGALAGTLAYRLKQIDLDGAVHFGPVAGIQLPAGVEEGTRPAIFSLSQNFPDPFNPVTTIRYTLPMPATVRVTIYNMLGQEVDVLVDGRETAGEKNIAWNAGGVASGVYFYRIVAISGNRSFSDVKKMVVVR